MTEQLEKQVLKAQRVAVIGLVAALLICAGLMIFVAVVTVHGKSDLQKSVERSNDALACYVTGQLDRAGQTLPTLAYYKDNPEELRLQLIDISRQRTLAIQTWGLCHQAGGTP